MNFSPEIASMVCRHEHFHTKWFERWVRELNVSINPKMLHRKAWEWAAIAQAFFERGMLAEGKRGLGFAVGTEPLSSLFSRYGATLEATDIGASAIADLWQKGGQWSGNLETLHKPQIVDLETFKSRVSYYTVDMKDLSQVRGNDYDFIWSSCSFEHLGNLDLGLNFVLQSSKLLKPGGVAVHTTEFNCMSDEYTLDTGGAVIYRSQDFKRLKADLEMSGFEVSPFDFRIGNDKEDILFDFPPYYKNGRHHIKFLLCGFISTSVILVIQRKA